MAFILSRDVEHLSSSKERDAETGLDFFGARYMSSAQGRWTSPDSVNLTDERVFSPSNTINKYIYGGNNPLKYFDPDGRDITVFYEYGAPTGHIMIAAYNQQNSDFGFLSVGPQTHLDPKILLHPFAGVPGTTEFKLPETADDLRNNFAAITIQTSPEVAQQAINEIRSGVGSGNWALLGNNCTSACAKVLHDIGLLPSNDFGTPFPRPTSLWNALRLKYQPNLSRWDRFNLESNSGGAFKVNNGADYGRPRYGINTFDFIFQMLQSSEKKKEQITSSICYGDEKKDCQ